MRIDLFISAGVATASDFMEGFRRALQLKLEAAGKEARSELLFPYGDWSRPVTAQLREIAHDLRPGAGYHRMSIGGTRLLAAVEKHMPERQSLPRRTILIGHSAGGIASVQAAQLLLHAGEEPCPIIMIGSPKCRIPVKLRDALLYIRAAGAAGNRRAAPKLGDPVTRIGTFGGWNAVKYRIPVWERDKHAPHMSLDLPIIGGHADYFREKNPYIHADGRSNLDMTLDAIWTWLAGRLE